MKFNRSPLAISLLALVPALSALNAATPVWDSNANPGIQAGSGTWDFDSTENWTLDGGATRVNWTRNSDPAAFQLQGNTGTVTVSDANGPVGAAGLHFSGLTGSGSGVWTVTGSSIRVGAGGLTNRISDGLLLISAPLELADSQTWSSTRLTASNSTAGVRIDGAVSSVSGLTHLTFDGRSLANPAISGGDWVTFSLGGANSFTGTTTVTGGAQLRLAYTSSTAPKLDENSALILAGGALTLNGGTGVEETVASTVIATGSNLIFAGPNGGGGSANRINLGTLVHRTGGTLEVTNAVSGIAVTDTALTNGIIGGWATIGGTRWASVNESNQTIVSTTGTTPASSAAWEATYNVVVNFARSESGITSKTINSLRLSDANTSLGFDSGATLTVTSGGIMSNANGQSINGGSVTTGQSSGELFIHTPASLTVSSAIVDNGSTPTVLVKAGVSSLTLTGVNTYTGGTYVNAGSLIIGSGGSVSGSVVVHGGATFDVTANGFTVASGKSLSGGGTVLGNVTLAGGGSLAPAYSFLDDQSALHTVTATLNLANDLSLLDGSTISLGLGINQDLIRLTGAAATLTGSASAGGITLNLWDAGGADLQTYTLLQWQDGTTLSGLDLSDFNVVTQNGIAGTLQFGTNSLEYVVTTIPEPSTVALAVTALGALVIIAGRRRRLGSAK